MAGFSIQNRQLRSGGGSNLFISYRGLYSPQFRDLKNPENMKNERRRFLKYVLMLTGGASLTTKAFSFGNQSQQHMSDITPVDPISPEIVKEFVGNAHGNLNRVKELLAQYPGLLNASWDWGGGDFETAMNAAGHMGRRDIAEFLLSEGARMDIFCAAMLGKIDVVKQILASYPNLKTSKGPHGLMLLHHARQGGEGSKSVLEYLEQIGAS
jgi:hypothetical protein